MGLTPASTGGEEPVHVVNLDELCAEGAAVLFETRLVWPEQESKDGKSRYTPIDVVLTVLSGKYAGTIDRTHRIMKTGVSSKLPRDIGEHTYGRMEFYSNNFGRNQIGLTGPQDGDLALAEAAIAKQQRTPAAAGATVGGGGGGGGAGDRFPEEAPF